MILAIGERFNLPKYEPAGDECDSFELRLQMGLYNYGTRREFLDRMGVHWDHGINLLWPHPDPGEWDVAEARRVAMTFERQGMLECYNRVLLFGERVCDAFDVPYKMGMVFGNFVPLNHPVGDGSAWDKDFIRRVLE